MRAMARSMGVLHNGDEDESDLKVLQWQLQ
jgi:hypothetical protein